MGKRIGGTVGYGGGRTGPVSLSEWGDLGCLPPMLRVLTQGILEDVKQWVWLTDWGEPVLIGEAICPFSKVSGSESFRSGSEPFCMKFSGAWLGGWSTRVMS